MKKLLLTLLLMISPVMAAGLIMAGNNFINAVLNNANETPQLIQSQSQLREQIINTIQAQNRSRVRINDTIIAVNSTDLLISEVGLKNQLMISSNRLVVGDFELLNASMQTRAFINITLNSTEVSIIKDLDSVRVRAQGYQPEVLLPFNAQLLIGYNTIMLNASGFNKNISVMPLQAVERVRATNNSFQSMELLMYQGRAVYRVLEHREARLFGFIPINLSVQSDVDATNGELVSVQKPWWNFLVIESN
ncbi:MAG: hypothetical protein WC307_02800 [Candidatus Nanoarchaeia archaeon]